MITENLSTLKIHNLTKEQYERELAAGRIDENALYLTPYEEQVQEQSDWNQTDETAVDYIKNRTHYSETSYTTLIDDDALSFTTGFFNYPMASVSCEIPGEGAPLRITFDGVVYERKAEVFEEIALIAGNKKFFGGEDTGEPFVYCCNSDFIAVETEGTHSVKIEKIGITYHKLPEEYMPDSYDEFKNNTENELMNLNDRRPNWRINNQGDTRYIEGRTHYTYEVEHLVHEEVITSRQQVLALTAPLNKETYYKAVITNGLEKYEIAGTFQEGYNSTSGFYGHYINGDISLQPDMNFDLYTENAFLSVCVICDGISSFPATLTITTLEENVVQLNEQYIPDTIARVSDIPKSISWNDLSDKPFGNLIVAEWEPSTPHAADADFSFKVLGGRPAAIYAIKVGDAPSRDVNFETLQFNGKDINMISSCDNAAIFTTKYPSTDYIEFIVCYESGTYNILESIDGTMNITSDAGIYVVYCDDTYGYEIENFENGGLIGTFKTIDEACIPDTIARVDQRLIITIDEADEGTMLSHTYEEVVEAYNSGKEIILYAKYMDFETSSVIGCQYNSYFELSWYMDCFVFQKMLKNLDELFIFTVKLSHLGYNKSYKVMDISKDMPEHTWESLPDKPFGEQEVNYFTITINDDGTASSNITYIDLPEYEGENVYQVIVSDKNTIQETATMTVTGTVAGGNHLSLSVNIKNVYSGYEFEASGISSHEGAILNILQNSRFASGYKLYISTDDFEIIKQENILIDEKLIPDNIARTDHTHDEYALKTDILSLDNTLLVEGAAADAKAVSNALAEKQPIGDYALKSDILSPRDEFILNSSTEGSTKQFKITIDDTGTLTVSEVV